MFQKTLFLFFIISFPITFVGQVVTRTEIYGKVHTDTKNTAGVTIRNKNTNQVISSKEWGYFSILAKEQDTLLISGFNWKPKTFILEKIYTKSDLLHLKMEPLNSFLEEVKIFRYNHINAESLGIIPKGIKELTPAERKLRTASNGKLNPMGLDPLINYLSGRTKILQTAVGTESKEIAKQKMEYLYEDSFYSNRLKIPTEFIPGFKFYLVEKSDLTAAIRAKEYLMTEFLIAQYATEFLNLKKNNSTN